MTSMSTTTTIRLLHGIHHDGADHAAGDTLELPVHQAIGYVKQGRAVAIGPLPGAPPLTRGSVVRTDPTVSHGDPTGDEDEKPKTKSSKASKASKAAESTEG